MIFYNRLSTTARSLRSWSKTLFNEARTQLLMANDIILRLDIAQESRALTSQELALHKEKELKTRVLGWAAIERSRRRQSSRLLQIKEGDACTNFFHQKANSHRQRNLIAYLKQDNGSIVWNHSEKENILCQYFAEILGSTTQRTCSLDWDRLQLSRVHDPSLDLPFTEDEIKKTQFGKCRERRSLVPRRLHRDILQGLLAYY